MDLYGYFKVAMRGFFKTSVVWTLTLAPTSASAFVGDIVNYLSDYQFGVDFTNSYDRVDATYEMNKPQAAPTSTCADSADHADKQLCTISISGASSSGYGIVIAQPFKRQGLFYFQLNLGFGARYLSGALNRSSTERERSLGLPLTQLKFNLGAVVVKPYIQFGITPANTWPDLLISLGPAAQMAIGNVTVNGQREDVAFVTASNNYVRAFVAVELVLWRFGKGSLSVFSENDISGGGRGSRFYPHSVDGMSDFHANFSRSVSGRFYGFGAKLLSNWP